MIAAILIFTFSSVAVAQNCRTIGVTDTAEIFCNGDEVLVNAGAKCHADWDQLMLESRPTSVRSWMAICVNHDNFGLWNPPAKLNAVCCPQSLFPNARYLQTGADAGPGQQISCNQNEIMINSGARCRYSWDQFLLSTTSNDPVVSKSFTCMNHDNSNLRNGPETMSAICFPRTNTGSSRVVGASDPSIFKCSSNEVLLNFGMACHADWDQMHLSTLSGLRGAVPVCMNHQNSNIQNNPAYANGNCYSVGSPVTNNPGWSIEDQVRRYAPIFALTADESYNPADPREYIKMSRVQKDNAYRDDINFNNIGTISSYNEKLQNILVPQVNGRSLYEFTSGNPSWSDCGTFPYLCGTRDTNNVPAYAIVADKPEINAVDVFYWVFFAYNQGKNVFGTSFGNHYGDWVHASIRFERSSGNPTQLHMDHHGHEDSYAWRPWSEAGKPVDSDRGFVVDGSGRPVVFLAKGSHEIYPSPGEWDLAKGQALVSIHDVTRDGWRWDLRNNLQLEFIEDDGQIRSNKGNNFLNFNGRYGIPQQGQCFFGGCQLEHGGASPSPSERWFMQGHFGDRIL
ncbi:hypothetical protein HDU92_001219 [Lobulomyces angularis]|nr:hypothetical protein HDU92_001219 [Lobulomyces angularis]